jgi:hypothetical protein
MTSIPDLFGSEPENACDVYRKLRRPDEYPKGQIVRQHCERLWRVFHPFAEPQFLAEFPLHFHQRWFEMYLTVTLLERGADVQPTAPPGPDILVIADRRRIWIEAVCGTGGQPGLPDSVVEGSDVHVPWDKIALRVRSSIEDKKNKYERYLHEGYVAADDSLLVALNVYEIPYAWSDSPLYIFRALFGVGAQVIHFALGQRTPPRAVDSTYEQVQAIPKLSSGSLVGTQPFIDGSMASIAACIVSAHSAGSAAHKPPDFTLYPNLTSAAPWNARRLPLPYEWKFSQTAEGWTGGLITA